MNDNDNDNHNHNHNHNNDNYMCNLRDKLESKGCPSCSRFDWEILFLLQFLAGRSTGETSRWKRWLAHCSGKTFAEHIHLSLLSGNHSFVGLLLCGATHPVQISSHLNVLCLLDILCLKFHTPIVKEQFCFCENLEFNWENNMNLMNIFIHSH